MKTIEHKFVDRIPKDIPEGVLYISIEFETAIHKCVCGCGREIVTPIAPTGWKLIFDGEAVSLHPSIGNWSFCKSHYWIKDNKIIWSDNWSTQEIKKAKKCEEIKIKKFFRNKDKKKKWWTFLHYL